MGTSHPDWVVERAKCNVACLAKDVRALVERDTTTMQKESKARELAFGFTYVPYQNVLPKCGVLRVNLNSPDIQTLCQFEYDKQLDQIIARIGHVSNTTDPMDETQRTYIIKTRWDAENIRCVIVVSSFEEETKPPEFPHDELWKAVQCILEPFFFPPKGHVSD